MGGWLITLAVAVQVVLYWAAEWQHRKQIRARKESTDALLAAAAGLNATIQGFPDALHAAVDIEYRFRALCHERERVLRRPLTSAEVDEQAAVAGLKPSTRVNAPGGLA